MPNGLFLEMATTKLQLMGSGNEQIMKRSAVTERGSQNTLQITPQIKWEVQLRKYRTGNPHCSNK